MIVKIVIAIYLLGSLISVVLYLLCAKIFYKHTNLEKMTRMDVTKDIVAMVLLSWIGVYVCSHWVKDIMRRRS